VFDTVVAAAFQNMCKANDVAINVCQRVVNGIAHTGLGFEIDHALRLARFKGVLNALAVGQVDAQMGVVGVLA
jgi:hypothetical protein